MENVPRLMVQFPEIFLLICIHLLMFRKFYFQNPYIDARGEPLEMEFPAWIHLGREIRHHGFFRVRVHDPYYFQEYHGFPILATYYPPHRISAWLSSFLGLDHAWILFRGMMVSHFLIGSIAVYVIFTILTMEPIIGVLNAITLSYLAYAMKQNCSIVYTLSWLTILLCSGLSHNMILFGTSLGMALLAGYWPLIPGVFLLSCLAWLLPSFLG